MEYTGCRVRPRNRRKHKGRTEGGGFVLIPWAVMDSDAWKACSAVAIKMLCELARQYNGRNNGDLSAAFSVLKKRGWASAGTISTALRELRHYGLIVLTRQGGLLMRDGGGRTTSLYALTWQPVDACNGKHGYPAGTAPPGLWRAPSAPFKRPAKKREPAPPVGAQRIAIRSDAPRKAA